MIGHGLWDYLIAIESEVQDSLSSAHIPQAAQYEDLPINMTAGIFELVILRHQLLYFAH